MADTFSLRERLHHLCYTTPAWGPFPLTIPSQDALFCHRRAAARVVATAIDTTLPSPGSQTEADIRSLSSALLAAIDQARANAARSRLQLDDLRGVIGAAATATEPALPTSALEALQAVLAARFSHLSSQLDRAEEVKTVTYERSLVAADGALETVTAELESVKIALSSLEPCELETQAAALVKRVEELHLLTSALPSAPPVTPMLAIALLPGELEALLDHFDALSSAYRDHEGAEEYLSLVNESLHSFGSIADGVVDASNIKVAIKGGSHRRRVLPGSTLELRATSSMSDPRASCPASIEAVADTLSRALKVSVRLATTATENVQRIVPFVSSNASDAAVSMTIAVPTDTPFDSLLSIDNIAIAMSGVDVPLELLDASLPLTFVVTRYVGIASMPTLTGMHSDNLVTPGVAEDGRLFMPQRKGVVTVYDGEGCAIESIEPELLCGRSSISETRACAFDDSASILFVASQTSVVALSGSTLSWNELWSRRGLDIVGGLAALPRHGLLAFTELNKNTLFLVRSSDGAEMTRVTGCNWISYVAYDPLHDTLFTSSYEHGRGVIHSWQWDPSSSRLTRLSVIDCTATCNHRPLAVMVTPAHASAPALAPAYLVVGTQDKGEVDIVELPSLRRVRPPGGTDGTLHVLDHPGAQIKGIAADPAGQALAYVDAGRKVVVVVGWPRDSMTHAADGEP